MKYFGKVSVHIVASAKSYYIATCECVIWIHLPQFSHLYLGIQYIAM